MYQINKNFDFLRSLLGQVSEILGVYYSGKM